MQKVIEISVDNSFKTNHSIIEEVETQLDEISRECGKCHISARDGDYIFCYESWSGPCFPTYIKFHIGGESERAIEYAERITYKEVIPEWKRRYSNCELVEDLSGYTKCGLSGISYATFKIKKPEEVRIVEAQASPERIKPGSPGQVQKLRDLQARKSHGKIRAKFDDPKNFFFPYGRPTK